MTCTLKIRLLLVKPGLVNLSKLFILYLVLVSQQSPFLTSYFHDLGLDRLLLLLLSELFHARVQEIIVGWLMAFWLENFRLVWLALASFLLRLEFAGITSVSWLGTVFHQEPTVLLPLITLLLVASCILNFEVLILYLVLVWQSTPLGCSKLHQLLLLHIRLTLMKLCSVLSHKVEVSVANFLWLRAFSGSFSDSELGDRWHWFLG